MMHIRGSIKPLAWESEFFVLNCGMIEFNDSADLLSTTELNQFDIVQAKVPAGRLDLVDALSEMNFRLVEGEMDFVYSVDRVNKLEYRVAELKDIPMLREIAATAFRFSRFRPPWYGEDDSGRFYALWVEKAVRGTFDDACLMIERDGRLQGFVTLRKKSSDDARIGLLAVWHSQRNRGMGHQLVQAAHHWCAVRGLKTLRVATQFDNLPAIRLYIRSGGLVTETAYWLYRK